MERPMMAKERAFGESIVAAVAAVPAAAPAAIVTAAGSEETGKHQQDQGQESGELCHGDPPRLKHAKVAKKMVARRVSWPARVCNTNPVFHEGRLNS
jgi:hypothetical protein